MPTRRFLLPRLVFTGMILSALPAMSLARQNVATSSSIRLILAANLRKTGTIIQASTEINELNLNQLAGNKTMSVGDVVYIHLNINADPVGENIFRLGYPYAVSQNRPARGDESTVSLRGVVTGRVKDTVNIEYLFETLPHNKALLSAISQAQVAAELTLDVNRRAVGHLKSVKISDEYYTLR